MFDLKGLMINRLKDMARNSPYFAYNLIKNIVFNTVVQGSSIALGFSNVWNYAAEFREIYNLKKYGSHQASHIRQRARRFTTIDEKIVLGRWLELNKNHRPSSIELNFLASQTKMSKVQIKKWLITNKYVLIKKRRSINFQHEKTLSLFFVKNAYPSKIEMQQLMNYTSLSWKQISQWQT